MLNGPSVNLSSAIWIAHDRGIKGIKYAVDQGPAIIVSDPLKRERLNKAPPASVVKIYAEAGDLDRLAELGLRFIWSHLGFRLFSAMPVRFAKYRKQQRLQVTLSQPALRFRKSHPSLGQEMSPES